MTKDGFLDDELNIESYSDQRFISSFFMTKFGYSCNINVLRACLNFKEEAIAQTLITNGYYFRMEEDFIDLAIENDLF